MVQSSSRDCESAYTTITGLRNREEYKQNEDVVFIDESAQVMFYGLADGQSGKTHCREGGLEVLKAVYQYVLHEDIGQLMQREHTDEIQFEVLRLIRTTIENLAKKRKTEKTEFASTLVAFAFDKRSNNYIALHLGDGGIIGAKNDTEDLVFISPPENGITARYTWLTTSLSVLSHLHIYFGSVEKYKRIVLYTDGAVEICHGKNVPASAKQLICKSRESKEIFNYMQENYHADDASCIVIDFDKTEMI